MKKLLYNIQNLIINLPENKLFLYLFIFSIFLYSIAVVKVKSILWGDSLYYYAYTRSMVIDHDIDFINEAYRPLFGFPNPPEISKNTSKITNKFSPGTSLFWIPGFIVGQVISNIGNFVTQSSYFLISGYGVLNQYFVGISAVSFSIYGLWYVYKTINLLFSKKIAVFTIILLFFTTSLFYYSAVDPVNSHSVSFMLSAILWYKFIEIKNSKLNWQKVLPIGILAGLIMLVRNQDLIISLPILIFFVFKNKERILNKFIWITLFVGSIFIIFSIQLFITLELFGVLGSPYLIRGEFFRWFNPDFFRVLFSFGNGLFLFSPILMFATLFLIRSVISEIKNDKRWFLSISFLSFLAFISQLYIIASWSAEIVGGPYGSRMFTSVLPHLAVGIALFIQYIFKKFTKNMLFFLSAIFVVLTVNMTLQTLVMLYSF